MASIFSKIISKEIPAHIVGEDDEFIAFLDIMPVRRGHVLVVPKKEVDYIFDLDSELLGRMMIFAQSISLKIKNAFPCNRIGVTVIGLEVPHAHIHLIPIDRLSDMDFSKPKMSLSTDELANDARLISNS
jgi:histidine triad (HIT) family protein